MSIEVEIPQTTISNKAIEVEYSNSNTAIAEGTKELEVSVNRREYNIVGDELYIPKRYEDAPQWLRDIIDTVTSTALSGAISDVSTLGDMLDGLIAELNVAKNTYTMSIISDNSINERINTAIETLNSSLAESDSTILDVAMTRVTPEQAQAIAIGILSASINGGDIAAAVQNLQSAIADVDSARALDYTRLTAQIGDGLEDEATARAEAISYLTTGVSNINGTLTTQAGQITALQTSASTVDSRIATAKSDVTNTLNTTITNGDITVQSKWAYNSVVNINGVYKKSGFGLTTNYTSGSGTEASPYVSEFWIDASRLKFTNSNNTGQVSPFTIDASGTTPQVKFNGVVEFSNITGGNSIVTTNNIQSAVTNNVTTIDGGKIVTNEAFVNNLNAVGGIVADYVNANEFNGMTFNGGIFNGARINGAVIKASYLDLDGELEVLTNYHISVAARNSNPSLYSDAVYISADNEYRIPSLSTIKEANKSVALHSVGASSTSLNRSYNTANVGHNNKCVNIRPTLNYNGTVLTITVNVAPFSAWDGAYNVLTSYATSLYCFSTFIGRFKLISTTGSGSEVYTQMYINDAIATSFSKNVNGLVFSASLAAAWVGGTSVLTVSVSCPNTQLYSNFTSGDILYAVTNSTPSRATSGNAINTSVSSTSTFTTSSGMTINNMI